MISISIITFNNVLRTIYNFNSLQKLNLESQNVDRATQTATLTIDRNVTATAGVRLTADSVRVDFLDYSSHYDKQQQIPLLHAHREKE